MTTPRLHECPFVLLKVKHFILIVHIAVGQVFYIAEPQPSIEAEDKRIAHLRIFILIVSIDKRFYFRQGEHILTQYLTINLY